MKALLLSLIVIASFQAPADQTTAPVVVAPCLDLSTIAVRVNKLIITQDDKVYWDEKPVILSRNNEGKNIRNGRAAFRLLLYLAKHPYQKITAEDLYRFAWGGRTSRDIKAVVRDELATVRAGFIRVDENFKALKTIWHYGFMWDDGNPPPSQNVFPDVPEIEVTATEIRWNGEIVKLSPPQRAMVLYLLKFRGQDIPSRALFRIFRSEINNLSDFRDRKDTLRQQFYLIRAAFLKADKNFDRIQNNGHKYKLWVVEKPTPSAQAAE
jgi:DNA-binding winged helix-turn-helix (wHTH) protein